MSSFRDYLARQCAVGREKFGPNERTFGVIDHICKEFDEIAKEENAEGRAAEWADVAILALDGLLRATREMLREQLKGGEGAHVDDGWVLGHNGEPTNDFVAATAEAFIRTKQEKNELRDFGDWRLASDDVAIEHKRGVHD